MARPAPRLGGGERHDLEGVAYPALLEDRARGRLGGGGGLGPVAERRHLVGEA